jgi:hypothetical protein
LFLLPYFLRRQKVIGVLDEITSDDVGITILCRIFFAAKSMVSMSGAKYLVCTLQPHEDPLAEGKKIYVSNSVIDPPSFFHNTETSLIHKGTGACYMRIYLLPTGELVYIDYVIYSDTPFLPKYIKSGICYGEGYPHYVVEYVFHYETLEDLQQDIPDIKEELTSFSKAIIKMDDVTGCYVLVQGQELRDILSGEKDVG